MSMQATAYTTLQVEKAKVNNFNVAYA